MSLEVFSASHQRCVEHMLVCDVLGCQTCRDIAERFHVELEWERDTKWEREYVADSAMRKENGHV